MIESALLSWLDSTFPGETLSPLTLVAGDASPRRYYRLALGTDAAQRSIIAAISPPSEKNQEFILVRQLLAAASVRVPDIYAADLEHGFLALEDLGDATLLPRLNDDSVDAFYGVAMDHLLGLSRADVASSGLPHYSRELLQQELNVFIEWFAIGLLAVKNECDGQQFIEMQAKFTGISKVLVDSAVSQPQVLVHRDFHSRNLMVLANDQLAVIDFQDAVIGPITYDPVSLLKDCYIAWPRAQQLVWLNQYQQRLEEAGVISPVASDDFIRWFDLMGLQRHIKVLGVFARLDLRDGKPAYLADLPLVLHYTREALALYQDKIIEVEEFASWFEETLMPLVIRQSWFRPHR